MLDSIIPRSFPLPSTAQHFSLPPPRTHLQPLWRKKEDPLSGLPALWLLIQRMLAGNRPYSQFAWLMSCRWGGGADKENKSPQNSVVWKLQPKNYTANLRCPFRKVLVPLCMALLFTICLKSLNKATDTSYNFPLGFIIVLETAIWYL